MTASKTILTSRDLYLLEDFISHDDMDLSLAAMLRDKLASARIVLPEDVPADVVTLDSRVRFALDGRRDERRLILALSREFRGQTLLVGTPLGAALLGMRTGDVGTALSFDGSQVPVTVIAVLYQPEVERHQSRVSPTLDVAPTAPIPFRRYSHSSVSWDDPGPSAA